MAITKVTSSLTSFDSLLVDSDNTDTTITIESDLDGSSLFTSGIDLRRETVAKGSRIESLRDASAGGVGLNFLTTADNAAEVSGTLTSRMVILESGECGIGTTSPTSNGGFGTPLLEVRGSSGGSLLSTNSTTSGEGVFTTRDTGINISMAGSSTASTGNNILFRTGSTNSDYNSTERMRINADGEVAIGGSAASPFLLNVGSTGNDSPRPIAVSVGSTSTRTQISFNNPNGGVGSIVSGGVATSYVTSSDYRLKENVVTDWDATTRLKQLRPSRFNFISDADTTVDGFLAHEVSDIVPEAITGEKDATETLSNVVLDTYNNVIATNIEEDDWTEGKTGDDAIYPSDSTWEASHTRPVYQGIDQSKLVPLLVKTIQELEARITTLENA